MRIGLMGAALAACSSAEVEPPFWRPSYEVRDAGAANAGGDEPGTRADAGVIHAPPILVTDGGAVDAAGWGPCSLAVSVTTAAVGGKYAPDNIGAIWIEGSGNAFVKTLDVWASRRIEHLDRWGAITAAAGAPNDTVDAITGATAQAHGVHTATWGCTDRRRQPSPDGAYRVCFELTDDNTGGPVECVPFVKGPSPARIEPADTMVFKKRSIVFTP